MATGQIGKPPHVGHLAVQVDREDTPGARSESRGDRVWVEVIVALAHIGHDRRRTRLAHRLERRDEGLSWDDHLVARLHAGRDQCEPECVEAARHADALERAAIGGKGVLEPLHVRPVAEFSAREECSGVGQHVPLDRGIHV